MAKKIANADRLTQHLQPMFRGSPGMLFIAAGVAALLGPEKAGEVMASLVNTGPNMARQVEGTPHTLGTFAGLSKKRIREIYGDDVAKKAADALAEEGITLDDDDQVPTTAPSGGPGPAPAGSRATSPQALRQPAMGNAATTPLPTNSGVAPTTTPPAMAGAAAQAAPTPTVAPEVAEAMNAEGEQDLSAEPGQAAAAEPSFGGKPYSKLKGKTDKQLENAGLSKAARTAVREYERGQGAKGGDA
jgi:hypothetical protein